MSQKILNLSEAPCKAAGRTEKRCRSLAHDLRLLRKPASLSEVCEMQLVDTNGLMYGGAIHCVEAQMLLESDLHVCVSLGWLKKTRLPNCSEERADSFDQFDVFESTLAAHRLKARIPSKTSSASSPPTITVKAGVRGTVASFRGERVRLSSREEVLLESLYLKNGGVLSASDMKRIRGDSDMKISDETLRKSVSCLRERLRKVKVDETALTSGITRVPGQGYCNDRNFLIIVWKSDPGRQSNVLNGLSGGSW